MHSCCSLQCCCTLRVLLNAPDPLMDHALGPLPQNLVRAQDAAAEEQASSLDDRQQQQQQERVSIWADLLATTSADAAAADATPLPGLARLPDADAMQEAVESATGGGSTPQQEQQQEQKEVSQAPEGGVSGQQQGAHQPQMQSLQAWLSARASRKRGAAKASASAQGATAAPTNATIGAASQSGEPEPLEWVWSRAVRMWGTGAGLAADSARRGLQAGISCHTDTVSAAATAVGVTAVSMALNGRFPDAFALPRFHFLFVT